MRRGLPAVAAAVALGASAGPALAATSPNPVAAKIKQETKLIRESSAVSQLKGVKDTATLSRADLRKIAKAFSTVRSKLDRAATAVAEVPASGTEKTGRREWVRGVREAATGLGKFVTAVRKLARGDKAGEQELIAADKAINAGDRLITKADKRLGLAGTGTKF